MSNNMDDNVDIDEVSVSDNNEVHVESSSTIEDVARMIFLIKILPRNPRKGWKVEGYADG